MKSHSKIEKEKVFCFRWGAMLRQYNGKATSIENTDLATNYLGYWMDNGAYYYYNPLPNTSYQDTVLELHANLSERIPVRWDVKDFYC